MDIRNYRHCVGVSYRLQDLQSIKKARPSIGVNGGAVGFVEGGLKHQWDAEPGAHRFVVTGHLKGKGPGLEHIDAADQNEWCIVGKTNGAEVDAAGSHGFKLLCSEAYGFFRSSLHLSHSVMQVDDDGTEFSFATTVFSETLKCADRKLGKVRFLIACDHRTGHPPIGGSGVMSV